MKKTKAQIALNPFVDAGLRHGLKLACDSADLPGARAVLELGCVSDLSEAVVAAVRGDSDECLRELLIHGALVGQKHVTQACEMGAGKALKELLKIGLYGTDPKDLVSACDARSAACVSALLAAGADVSNKAALRVCCARKNAGLLECARLLLKAGAKPDIHCLREAIAVRAEELAKLLIQGGAAASYEALSMAVGHRLPDIAADLVARGAPLKLSDPQLSVFVQAARDDPAVCLLPVIEADIKARPESPERVAGLTLALAVLASVKDATKHANGGKTPNSAMKAARALIKHGALVDSVTRGSTPPIEEPIAVALWRRSSRDQMLSLDLAWELYAAGANVNKACSEGNVALHYACRARAREIPGLLKKLIGLRARGDVANAAGETPLHWCQKANDDCAEIVALLVSAGAQVDAKDKSGATPLLAMAAHGNYNMAKALLDAGADPTVGGSTNGLPKIIKRNDWDKRGGPQAAKAWEELARFASSAIERKRLERSVKAHKAADPKPAARRL